jgi:hypothetical protein
LQVNSLKNPASAAVSAASNSHRRRGGKNTKKSTGIFQCFLDKFSWFGQRTNG